MFNNKDINFNLDYKKLKIYIFEQIYGDESKLAPYDMLTDEVRIACSNIKSCLTNLKNKNITHFEIRERKNDRNFISILIPKHNINKNGIFTRLMKKINNFEYIFNS